MTVREDLEAQYEQAKTLVAELQAEWEAQGKPFLAMGGATGRAEVAHPLLVLLQSARRDVDRFAKQLDVKHAGPQPSAVVRRSVGGAGSSKLRSVG